MGFARHIVGIVFGLILIAFCVFNRGPAAVTWSPFHAPLEFPLYGLILGSAVFGFLWGGLTVFMSHISIRRDRRRQKQKIRSLEKELHSMQQPQIPGLMPPV